MQFFKILEELGLSEKEAKIYLFLLEFDASLASTIARKTAIKRPTVYMVLESLRARGFVTTYAKAGVNYFSALDPELLLQETLNKYTTLKAVVPELKKLNSMFQIKPQMSIFEGKEGLIHLMEDTLTTENGELLVWADITLAWDGRISEYYPEYVRKRVAKNIIVRGIFPDSPSARGFKKRSKKELREVYLIPPNKFPFKNEINIYNNKMNIISYQDEIGVLIENENIASTQKSIFSFAWEYAKMIDKSPGNP